MGKCNDYFELSTFYACFRNYFFSKIQHKNIKRFKMINIVLFTPVIPLFIHLIKEVIQRF